MDKSPVRPTAGARPPGQPVEPSQPPLIKPLLIEPPRPPAGPDGFAPAPIIPPPEPLPSAVPPTIHNGTPTPLLPVPPGTRFGHAPDHQWLVGTLDRHARGGYWTLRYADVGVDDPWGGKVRLLDDPRLADFGNGDHVYVEGQLLAPPTAAKDSVSYPPYRILTIRRIDPSR